jgi:hypothetical protein
MLIGPEFDSFFIRAMDALRPYTGDIVCIGGCANALYRHHLLAAPSSLAYVGTYDIDLAVADKVPVRNRKPIAYIMTSAGMKEQLYGTSERAVVKYAPADESIVADVEFLCSSSGLTGTRGGKGVPIAHEVQKKVMAQPMRYLELLLTRPWVVDVGNIPGFAALKSVQLRIPNPASYIVQKILIQHEGRKRESVAKDFYYIFEVSVLFRNALDELRCDYQALCGEFPMKWMSRFERSVAVLFRDPFAEGPVMAAQVHRGIQANPPGEMPVDEVVIAASVQRLIRGLCGEP